MTFDPYPVPSDVQLHRWRDERWFLLSRGTETPLRYSLRAIWMQDKSTVRAAIHRGVEAVPSDAADFAMTCNQRTEEPLLDGWGRDGLVLVTFAQSAAVSLLDDSAVFEKMAAGWLLAIYRRIDGWEEAVERYPPSVVQSWIRARDGLRLASHFAQRERQKRPLEP